MAADLGWMSGHTSSLDITIISILFLIGYIALYTLCTTCFSETPECPEEKEIPSSLSLSVNLGDHQRTMNNVDVLSSMAHSSMPQVPAGPQHKNHTIVYSQQTNIYSHNRAKSDSYFSQQMTPRIPDTPAFSVRSTGAVSPGLPALPPIPPIFYLTTVQMEPPKESSSGQQPKTVKTVWDFVTLPEDQPNMNSGFTEIDSEEHPYACLDNVRVSGPSSPSHCDEADEDRWESESPYHMVTEWIEPTPTCDLATLLPVTDSEKAEELEFLFPPLPAVQDDQPLINTDRTAIYAAVNRKNKSQKSNKEAPVVQDTMVLDEDEAPPVPEKIFD
ncbi:uncharacterized protein LOC113546789 [Pangasianodon hypophthalmus]|uniref:uncharacterized protein LOC113546789 n=1 Tax=Pangasianodon hypophthalmus TaxID=310915 RepID=UPI000F00ABCC|nr:uncharacterized protein LOC113546789 [Pangasianodon hypophthalmus]